jgi:circadian clock protein KaiC
MRRVDEGDRAIYSISAVGRMVGLPAATIRTWEDRYGLVVPDRNASGHRLYSRDQVEQLRFLTTQTAQGLTAADAHRLLAGQIGEGRVMSAPAGLPRLLILLVEQDPYAAEYQEYFLKTEGFEVEMVFDAQAARRAFDDSSPSLAVIELLISGGSGLALCRHVKAGSSIPVIAVSVLECRDRAIEAGADAFLLKPLDPLLFVSTVRDLLGSSAFPALAAGSLGMIHRLLSGHEPLDSVLGGGLPGNAITLLMGRPGSGKTILAQQYAFGNAAPEHPTIYFSTVSEPLEKIVRFAQGLHFFDAAAVGTSVFYEDLGSTVNENGLTGVTEQIAAAIKDRRPGLIVIDSFKALHAFAADHAEFRRFLHELAGRLGAFPVASLWVGEYDDAEIGLVPEFAVADAILDLTTARSGQRDIRFLEVRKLRGSSFRSGQHAYRLTAEGMHLFPRLADTPISEDYPLDSVRASSGIPALDDMLGDGYWPGASTLIAGPTGTGKTLMGLHFIVNGARQGEPGVIATLQENPTQLERVASGFGWSADEPGVELMYRSPVDIHIDEWAYELMRTVKRARARRILVDSLTDLRTAAPDNTRFREFAYSLLQRFARQGVTVMLTFEIPDLFGADRLSEDAVSPLSDNVVLLSYLRDGDLIGRTMSVIKTRASHHDPAVRRFLIGPQGIVLD